MAGRRNWSVKLSKKSNISIYQFSNSSNNLKSMCFSQHWQVALTPQAVNSSFKDGNINFHDLT